MRIIQNYELLLHYFQTHQLSAILGNDIVPYMQLYYFEKDEIILKACQELESFYFLVHGSVKIVYSFESGKSVFLKYYEPLSSFGDIELLQQTPVRCQVQSVQSCYTLAVPCGLLRENYLRHPAFLQYLADTLSNKLLATINNSSYNYAYPLINRLVSYLWDHLCETNQYHLPVSFEELAQYLGTTYRHLNRTFRQLETASIICMQDKSITLLDRSKLQAYTKHHYIAGL